MSADRIMPIGFQDFEDLRNFGCVYVDKTEYMWNLITRGKQYFLSRPRRFGKSLLLTTMKAYFLGKKDLFDGLAIETLEKDNKKGPWTEYPVFHLDFNSEKYSEEQSLDIIIDQILLDFEQRYDITEKTTSLAGRFKQLIRIAHETTGKQAVVLIDEYDKPLLQVIDNQKVLDDYRATLKAFYGVLKSESAHLRFVFITGVTRFSNVSIFSDLNQLNDISMDKNYSSICGITTTELKKQFQPEIKALAEEQNITIQQCEQKLKQTYDGYHFHYNGDDIYNPLSLLNAFAKNEFYYYWFKTGTPSFLVNIIKKNKYDLSQLFSPINVYRQGFEDTLTNITYTIPLMYQSGYLTIKSYNPTSGNYSLGFPNDEVKFGCLNAFLPLVSTIPETESVFYIGNFIADIQEGKVDAFMTRLKSILSSAPYPMYDDKKKTTEYNFHTACAFVFQLMGQQVESEVHSAQGRADCIVKTQQYIYVFEFKLNGTAQEALQQIEDKQYATQYEADSRKLVKVGVGFDKETVTIDEWLIK